MLQVFLVLKLIKTTHLSHNDIFGINEATLNISNPTTNEMIVGFKAFERFKLLACIETST
jgi:hypothetical protein